MKNLIILALFLISFYVMGQNFDTEFKYTNSINKDISIQNSYPIGSFGAIGSGAADTNVFAATLTGSILQAIS